MSRGKEAWNCPFFPHISGPRDYAGYIMILIDNKYNNTKTTNAAQDPIEFEGWK